LKLTYALQAARRFFAVLQGAPQSYLHRPKFNAPHRATVRRSE
jgi:hypothetical protein